MIRWFPKVSDAGTDNHADLLIAATAMGSYIDEYAEAKAEVRVRGRIEDACIEISALYVHRLAQLQDIEAILDYVENREKRATTERTRHYLEHYQRTLSDRVAKDYAEASDEVQFIRSVRQQVVAVRNLFIILTKGFETLHFQLSNVTKLRIAGLEDAEVRVPRLP